MAAGHTVEFVGDWRSDPGDTEILRLAHESRAVLVTRDKDFGTLAVLRGHPHHGIVRLVELPPDKEREICLAVLAAHSGVLIAGALVTVTEDRIRIRGG